MRVFQLNKVVPVIAFILIVSFFVACTKEKGETNEEEVITTLVLRFTPVGGGSATTFQFRDADGPGGGNPVADAILLAPNTSYNVTLQLLNELASPVEDVTIEVEEESQAHRFYFEPTTGSGITVNGLNNDINGLPLGTTAVWTTGAAADGEVTVTLRHYPGEPPGKESGDPVDSPKSGTDVTATFPTVIR